MSNRSHPIALMLKLTFMAAFALSAYTTPCSGLSFSGVATSCSVIYPHMGESTNVVFTIDGNCTVSVWIKNEEGTTVRTLCDHQQKTAGAYSIAWDGKNSSGAIVPEAQYTVWLKAASSGTSVNAYESISVAWPDTDGDVEVASLAQSVAAGSASGGSSVNVKLNGSSIGTTTSDLQGNFQVAIAGVQSSNTLIAEATHPLTGRTIVSDSYAFLSISNVSVSPNPFDPSQSQSATISYSLPQAMVVSILIIDEEKNTVVKTLLNEESQSSGSHSVVWDGKNDSGSFQCAGRHTVMISGTGQTASADVITSVDSPGPRISGIATTDATSSSVTVAWNTDAESDSQVMYGETDSLGSATALDSNMVTSHSVTVSGLTSGHQYYYRIVSSDSSSHTSTSGRGVFEASSLPSAPSGVQATPLLHGVHLNWTAGGAGTVSYHIHRSTTSGFTCSDANLLGDSNVTNFDDLTAVTGTTYYYKVMGKDYNSRLTAATAQPSAAPLSAPTTVEFLEAEGAGGAATWTGNWTTVNDSKANGGQYRRSDGGTNCAVEFTVTGPEIVVVRLDTDDGALADVYVDSNKVADHLDFSSKGAGTSYGKNWLITGLANTSHSVKIQYAAPGSGGTSATYMCVDVLQRHVY